MSPTAADDSAPRLPPPAPRRRLPAGLAAFRHRNYRLFWFGQLVSVTGTWMQTLAQSWLVLSLTSSAFLLGLVAVFQFAPVLLLGMVAGVIADRVPKRNLLVVTQALAAVQAALLALLVWSDRVELWHVYALALGLGTVNAFDMPTRQSFVVEMVGKEDLHNAIALNSSLFNAARIVGPALAGVLLAAFGPAVCFGLNAVSYAAVIGGLLSMRVAPRAVAVRGRGLTQLREGLGFVRRTPEVLRPILLVGMVATFAMNFNIWVPLLAKHDLSGGAGSFGLLMSAMGLGALSGALSLAFFRRRVGLGAILATASLMGTFLLMLALVGAIPLGVPVAMLVLAAVGFCNTSTMSSANAAVQTAAPDELRGRVMAVYMTVNAGTTPFGALVAGAISSRFGTPTSLAVGGLVTLSAVAAIALWGQHPAVVARRLVQSRRAQP
jgi:MFS family permease